jgi:membrane associated rhomboid family serine protease
MNSYRQSRFPGFPPVIKWLIIINFGVWIMELLWHGPWFLNYFSLFDVRSPYFKPHQFISYMFLHDVSSPQFYLHILLNMFALWMFGNLLEQRWGSKRFLNFYLITGIGAGILYAVYLYFVNTPYINAINEYQLHPNAQLLNEINSRFFNGGLNTPDQVDPVEAYNFLKASGPMQEPILGASGAIFGILVAFAMTFPNMEMFIIPIPFPIKAKYVVLGYIVIEIWSGVSPRAGDNVAHFAHLGGALVGFITLKLMNKFDRRHFY